jgi:hypothetical protein
MIMYSSIWRFGRPDTFTAFGGKQQDGHGARRVHSLHYGMND